MNDLTCKEAAEKWGVSSRRVAALCEANRIPGAYRHGDVWAIPADAEKPPDSRVRKDFSGDGQVRPIVKWAGGKRQLLDKISRAYPDGLGDCITTYAEPFIGGAAVLFDVLSRHSFEEVYVSDTNRELVQLYISVRDSPEDLVDLLEGYEDAHMSKDADGRKAYFYKQRDRYNRVKSGPAEDVDWIECSALFVYLNKTCFNGLYRVNAKGEFNVPSGVYKNPMICDAPNIKAASKLLQGVSIRNASYLECEGFADDCTFAYFDPPYRPLSASSSFTSYTEGQFDDGDQRELAALVRRLSDRGAKVMVSNSDPKNTCPDDDFFDDLYAGMNINRIQAARAINSKGDGRGKISELLITNYPVSFGEDNLDRWLRPVAR